MQLLIGLASTPDRYGNLERCRAGLAALGRELAFEVLPAERILASREDAEATARLFAARGVDLALLLCNSFTPDGTIVLPLAALPGRLGLWALPEPARKGPLPLTSLVDLNLFASVLQRYGAGREPRCKWFLGAVDDVAFRRRLEVTVHALRVIKGLSGATIAYAGGYAPGFENLAFDEQALAENLGVRVTTLPLDEVVEAARAYADEACRVAGARIAAQAGRVSCSPGDLVATGRIALALERMREEGCFSALAVACWPRFYQELGVFPCVAYGTLNARGEIVACEGDVLGAVSMLALALAGDDQPTLMDLVSVLPDEDALCFWHCGLATWNLAGERGVELITRPVPQPDGSEAAVGGFAGVTFAPGPATIARIGCDGAQLLVATAQITDRLGPGYEGSGGWFDGLQMAEQPATALQFLDAAVRQGVAHHYAISPGDVAGALMEAAAWLGMRLVEPQSVTDHI